MQTPYQIVVIAGLALATLIPGPSHASQEDLVRLRAKAVTWLEAQISRQHPTATPQVDIAQPDPRLRYSACDNVEFILPANARLWAGGALGVHCTAPKVWTIYFNYRIRLSGPGLTARKPLAARQPVSAEDVEARAVEYDRSPSLYLTQLPEGAHLTRALAQGQALIQDMLVMPEVIKAGKKVNVRFRSHSIQVSHEGVAQNAARVGESVRVKVSSGRLITGIAGADGAVEVTP